MNPSPQVCAGLGLLLQLSPAFQQRLPPLELSAFSWLLQPCSASHQLEQRLPLSPWSCQYLSRPGLRSCSSPWTLLGVGGWVGAGRASGRMPAFPQPRGMPVLSCLPGEQLQDLLLAVWGICNHPQVGRFFFLGATSAQGMCVCSHACQIVPDPQPYFTFPKCRSMEPCLTIYDLQHGILVQEGTLETV